MAATCFICNQTIDPGVDVAMPCCDNKCHNLCAIRNVAQQAFENAQVTCVCGHVLFANPTADSYSVAIEELLTRDGIQAEIKVNRGKITRLRSAITRFHRIMQSKKGIFNTAVLPHIEAIKSIKSTMTNEIKQTPEYKEVRSLLATFKSLKTRFTKRHDISSDIFSRLHAINRPWWFSWYSPARKLKRAFRIRI